MRKRHTYTLHPATVDKLRRLVELMPLYGNMSRIIDLAVDKLYKEVNNEKE